MVLSDQLLPLQTPALVLNEARMIQNIARLRQQAARLGVQLRPHLKTVKSVDVARQILAGGKGPATVSTLKEAEIFAAAGITDILYAVGIAPDKLARVVGLRRAGCDLSIVLDSVAQAHAVVSASRQTGDRLPTLIEIDCDGHRSGLTPDDPALVEIGRILVDGGVDCRGVITHAGESYGAVGAEALATFAERERSIAVAAAERLRQAGVPCPVVSVGSTPTAHFAQDLQGVTEIRAGVYVFFDLVMAGLGVCTLDDIALSVLTTVIGHQDDRGWTIVDAGWMAMSRDLGTASQAVDQGYGVVCDIDGRVLPDFIMIKANQEHGICARRPGTDMPAPHLPIGTRLRILPNHACATGAQFDAFEVIRAAPDMPLAHWPRFRGW